MTGPVARRRIGCDPSGAPLPGEVDAQRRFHIAFRAGEEDIDELGHVNNATWVGWIQDASVAHWFASARPGDVETYVAMVLRHEVDYRGNIRAGEQAHAVTWIEGPPRGARYTRRVDFTNGRGRLLVSAVSQWALIEKATGRLVRIPAELAAPFLPEDGWDSMAAWLAGGAPFDPALPTTRIDTHAACVFLNGDSAWKIKRPVRYSYLDFSTADRRRAALEAECALNRRTAPALYRGVHPIRRHGRTYAIGGAGEVVDWILEMGRLPDGAVLHDRLGHAALEDALLMRLAQAIISLHASAQPLAQGEGAGRIARIVEGNQASMAALPALLDPDRVAALTRRHRALVERHAPLLDARAAAGRVRHGHGDLHLRNIAVVDGEPVLFDCLEFDPELAMADVLYDLAFLLMDLWARGLRHEANLVCNRYLDLSAPDEAGLALIPLFMSIRAAIRAHVMAAQARGPQDEAARQAQDYLALGEALVCEEQAGLVAIGGFSGTGKSTLARALGGDLGRAPGARILRSDVLRKRLAGLAPETRLAPAAYTAQASLAVHGEIGRLATAALAAGHWVIADAVHGRAAEREAIERCARARSLPFAGIWLRLAEAERIARIESRGADASDADGAVTRAQGMVLDEPAEGWAILMAGVDGPDLLRQAEAVVNGAVVNRAAGHRA